MNPDHHRALRDAGLTDRPARVLDAPGGGTALLVDVADDELLTVWARAREAVGRTGRWPLLCNRDDEDLFSRFYFEEGAGGADSDPAAILARAETIDVDARLTELRSRFPSENVDPVDYERSLTLAAYGEAPSAQEIRAAVGGEPARISVERYLFDWERAREPLGEPDPGVQDWFGSEHLVCLALLPTAVPWESYAYVHALDAAGWYGQDLLVAAARRWHERFGAEPVGAFGVMTWLKLARPPADPETAWRLAIEHATLAENTLSTPGIPVRAHARQLPALDRWVLFSRP
ncbi:DUF4253 domain-containing protein [Phytomonospora sp. NPDC050363]|uniref:DUF4253 domain-containing protein n=1 Tax=Phytomonospora sp. NPDC050363 TaxID=3155642 RepID=UPI0033CAFBC2